MARSSAAAVSMSPRIPESDPVVRAILNAPLEDMPETEQEICGLEEARPIGRFVSSTEVSQAVAARR